ncbi:MAG: ribose 5-phosphate isomerase B [Kordiimonas sp.]
MSANRIAVASDHAGYELKEELKRYLISKGHDVLDLGTNGPESVDYPDFGTAMGKAIENAEAGKGVLVCGSGIGISIAANRNPAVRAALCQSGLAAKLARQHNDANVLALGARLIGVETAIDCVDAFFATDFEGGRHQRRVDKMGGTS